MTNRPDPRGRYSLVDMNRVVDRYARLAAIVLWLTVVGGFGAIASALMALYVSAAWADVLPFLGLAVVADLLGVELVEDKRGRWTLSLAIAVMMAAVAFNPLVAPLVGMADGLIHVARSKTRRIDKMLFNFTNMSLATGVASAVYIVLEPALRARGLPDLAAGFCAVMGFYAVNTTGVSLMISLSARRSIIDVIRESAWSLPINICLGLTGAFVGSAQAQLGLIGMGMFVVPLGILRFTLMIFARKSREAITTLQSLNEQLSGEIVQRSVAEAALGESEAHLRAVLGQRRRRHSDRGRRRIDSDVQSGGRASLRLPSRRSRRPSPGRAGAHAPWHVGQFRSTAGAGQTRVRAA